MKNQNHQNEEKQEQPERQNTKHGRNIIANKIPVEVDLQNRQVFIESKIKESFNFEFNSTDMDKLIKTYIDEQDSQEVIQSLTEAEKGLEKPFKFHFIHPLTAKRFQYEYRYQIVYVKYASTRLRGELIHIRKPNLKKKS